MLPTPRVVTSSTRGLLGSLSRQGPKVTASTGPARGLSSTPSPQKGVTTLLQDKDGFGFARSNPRPPKPRTKGVTEIRGPYYSVCMIRCYTCAAETNTRHRSWVNDTSPMCSKRKFGLLAWIGYPITAVCRMGTHVDGLKFSGGQHDLPQLCRIRRANWTQAPSLCSRRRNCGSCWTLPMSTVFMSQP